VRREQLFELLDILSLLDLHVAPEFLQVCPTVGVGDVLVESPHGVEPPAQFVNQVVIVIRASARLSDVFVFFFGCHGHGRFPFPIKGVESRLTNAATTRTPTIHQKTDVAEHPQVFRHVGLLFNKPSAEADCSLSSHPKRFSHFQPRHNPRESSRI
jgi:hypothetical protein